jgi:hypothetical protein
MRLGNWEINGEDVQLYLCIKKDHKLLFLLIAHEILKKNISISRIDIETIKIKMSYENVLGFFHLDPYTIAEFDRFVVEFSSTFMQISNTDRSLTLNEPIVKKVPIINGADEIIFELYTKTLYILFQTFGLSLPAKDHRLYLCSK